MEGRGTEGAAGAAGGIYMEGTPPGERVGSWGDGRGMGWGQPCPIDEAAEVGGREEGGMEEYPTLA